MKEREESRHSQLLDHAVPSQEAGTAPESPVTPNISASTTKATVSSTEAPDVQRPSFTQFKTGKTDTTLDKMPEQSSHHDVSNTPSLPTPGEMLKKAREKKNLSIDHVAKQLRLTTEYIEEIETDQYRQITSAAYARGYLRAYSRLVDLEDSQIIAAFDALNLLPQVASPHEYNLLYERPIRLSRRNTWYWFLATAVASLLIISTTLLFPARFHHTKNPGANHETATRVVRKLPLGPINDHSR